ncbi:hypothetical protein MBLNU13_g04350t1 [Cladosporium sp. NU13]
MPEDQRRSYLEPHLAQWEHFLQSRPNHASICQSSLSQVASSTSPTIDPAGAPVLNVTSTFATSRKTRFFSKPQGRKGKASSPAGVPVLNATSTSATSRKKRFFIKLQGVKGRASLPAGTPTVAP